MLTWCTVGIRVYKSLQLDLQLSQKSAEVTCVSRKTPVKLFQTLAEMRTNVPR